MIAKEVIPQVYGLLPREEEAVNMDPSAITQHTKDKVAYWENNLQCYHQGVMMGIDGKVWIPFTLTT